MNVNINLGTVGSDITTVAISGCTGINSSNECTGCTSISASELVSSFPKVVGGFTNSMTYVHIQSVGGSCAGQTQCLYIQPPQQNNNVTPTPTITPTITPTLTPDGGGSSGGGTSYSYGISLSPTTADDGGGAYEATITSTDPTYPQQFYVTILSTVGTVDSADFQSNFPSSPVILYSGQKFAFSLAEDHKTEGTEKFKLQLRSGSASGTILATSDEITITDGSLDIVYYQLRPCDMVGQPGYLNGDYDVYSDGVGTFNSGERVEGSTNYFYVVVGSTTTDPGGTKYTVTSTGLTGCPDTGGGGGGTYTRTAYLTGAWTTSSGPTLSQIKADACGKMPYQLPSYGYDPGSGAYTGYTQLNQNGTSFYVDAESITPGTTYTLYDANTGGNVVNGGDKWYAILWNGGGNTYTYVAYITTNGTIQDWTTCTQSVNTTPSWTYQYQTCDNCVTRDVEMDTNNNSATYGQYRVNGTIVSQPSNGACTTTQIASTNSSGTHYGCVVDQVSGQGELYGDPIYINTNNCYTGTEIYLWNGTWVTSNPANTMDEVTSSNWLTMSQDCVDNKIQYNQKDWGPCSPTFGQTRTVYSNDFCTTYTYYATYTYSCADIDDPNSLKVNVYYNATLNDYRIDGEGGTFANGTLYNVDNRHATFFDQGTKTGENNYTCD